MNPTNRLTVGIWSTVAYSGMKSAKSNTINCQVKQLKAILLSHGLLHFVAFVLAAALVISVVIEYKKLKELGDPDPYDDEAWSPIFHPISIANTCLGLVQIGLVLVFLGLLIPLTVKTFVGGHCARGAPLYFAFAKPYIIGVYSVIALGILICLISCIFACWHYIKGCCCPEFELRSRTRNIPQQRGQTQLATPFLS